MRLGYGDKPRNVRHWETSALSVTVRDFVHMNEKVNHGRSLASTGPASCTAVGGKNPGREVKLRGVPSQAATRCHKINAQSSHISELAMQFAEAPTHAGR